MLEYSARRDNYTPTERSLMRDRMKALRDKFVMKLRHSSSQQVSGSSSDGRSEIDSSSAIAVAK